jgi:hypothetical protein
MFSEDRPSKAQRAGVVVRTLIALLAAVLIIPSKARVAAQVITVGGGVSAGSVPRALAPLCSSARRLDGWGLSGRVAFSAGVLRIGGAVDYLTRYGAMDAASCIPRSGVSVDSSFASAGRAATSLAFHTWVPVGGTLFVGAEAGSVINHASWFVGPTLGAQYRRLGVEVSARRHVTHFDEITRSYASGTTYEISRTRRSERSWGLVARLMLLNRGNAF